MILSLRIATTLLAVSSSLLLMMGCATQTDGEGEPDLEGSANEAPSIDVDQLGTEATGQSCSCPQGQEYQNGLCYAKCAAGWSGEGPVCWKTCAAGFTDTGMFCNRSGSIVKANTSKCPWYNKCGLGSSCSKCPDGYSNDGCTCRRDPYIYAQESYGRGAGTTPSCSTF